MTEAIDFTRQVFARAFAYLRQDAKVYAFSVGLIAILSVLIDTQLPASIGPIANAVVGGLNAYLQLLITFRMLHANGAEAAGYTLQDKTEGRLPSLFVIGILEYLAVLIGLFFLVVPGVLLMLLWSLATPALAAERLGASAAMSRSWRLARHSLGPLAVVGSVFVLAVIPIAAVLVAAVYLAPHAPWLVTLITDVPMPAITLASAAVWTAAYLELRDGDPTSVSGEGRQREDTSEVD